MKNPLVLIFMVEGSIFSDVSFVIEVEKVGDLPDTAVEHVYESLENINLELKSAEEVYYDDALEIMMMMMMIMMIRFTMTMPWRQQQISTRRGITLSLCQLSGDAELYLILKVKYIEK